MNLAVMSLWASAITALTLLPIPLLQVLSCISSSELQQDWKQSNRVKLAHPTRTMPTQCHIHCVPKAAAASKSACIATCGRICQKFPGSSYGSGVACYGSADSPAALPAPDQISRFAIHVELPSCITVPFHPLLHQCPARWISCLLPYPT